LEKEMMDLESSKRFIEALAKGDQICRECQHKRYIHLRTCVEIMDNDFEICKCPEFVPPDNLDYVEYLAKKRGLI
jgi:hypothetical protein